MNSVKEKQRDREKENEWGQYTVIWVLFIAKLADGYF